MKICTGDYSGNKVDFSKVNKGDLLQLARGDWFKVHSRKGQVGEPNTVAIEIGPGSVDYLCRDLFTDHRQVISYDRVDMCFWLAGKKISYEEASEHWMSNKYAWSDNAFVAFAQDSRTMGRERDE